MFLAKAKLSLLNKILEHNEGSINLLKHYHGKSFKLNLVGISIAALITDSGLLQVADESTEFNVDVFIPPTTASYLVNQDKLDAFKKISFHGDIEFGRAILEIMANLHLSGLYTNTSPAAGLMLSQLGKVINMLKEQMLLVGQNSSNSVSEYLLYESEDIVTRYEIQDFCDNVDDLNNRLNLINQRINNLLTLATP